MHMNSFILNFVFDLAQLLRAEKILEIIHRKTVTRNETRLVIMMFDDDDVLRF